MLIAKRYLGKTAGHLAIECALVFSISFSTNTQSRGNSHSSGSTTSASKNNNKTCPRELFRQVSIGDTRGGYLGFFSGVTADDACRTKLKRHIKSPSDLEKLIDQTDEYGTGTSSFISSCAKNWKSKSNCTRNSPCTRLSEDQQFSAVGDYYYNMTNLRLTAMSSFEGIAAIDRLTGSPVLQGHSNLSDGDIPGIGDYVSKFKSEKACLQHQPDEFHAALDQTKTAVKNLEIIRNKLKSLKYKRCPPGRSCYRDPALAKNLLNARASILRILPWLNTDTFKDVVNGKKKPKEESLGWFLEKGLGEIRSGLSEELTEMKEISNCIHGGNGCIKKHLEKLAEIPSVEPDKEGFRRLKDNDREGAEALFEMGNGQCRRDIRVAKKQTGEVINSALIGAALTVGTFGVGALASASINGAKISAMAARFPKSIQALEVATNRGLTTVATKFPTSVKLAQAAAFGADGLWLGASGSDALNECNNHIASQISQEASESVKRGEISCTTAQINNISISTLSRSCVMSASMAAIDALPFTPAVFSTIRKVKAAK